MDERSQAFVDALRDRYESLGFTQHSLSDKTAEVDAEGEGLSVSLINKLANGKVPERLHTRTGRLLDRALRWPEGTAAALAAGEEPPSPEAIDPSIETRIEVLEKRLDELTDLATQTVNALLGLQRASAIASSLEGLSDRARALR